MGYQHIQNSLVSSKGTKIKRIYTFFCTGTNIYNLVHLFLHGIPTYTIYTHTSYQHNLHLLIHGVPTYKINTCFFTWYQHRQFKPISSQGTNINNLYLILHGVPTYENLPLHGVPTYTIYTGYFMGY